MAIKSGWDFPSPTNASTRAYTRERGVGEKSPAVGRNETSNNAPTAHVRKDPRAGRYAPGVEFSPVAPDKNEDAQNNRTGRQAVQTHPVRKFAQGGAVKKAEGGRVDPAAAKSAKDWVNDDGAQRIFERRDPPVRRKLEPEPERRELSPEPQKAPLSDFKMSKGGSTNWIAGATKNKGALHKALGVPQGEKIPAKKLDKAANSSNPTMKRRANLARTLKGLNKG